MKFILKQPQHGWLPVRIESGSSIVEFEASDIPNNPIQQLIAALHAALWGNEAVVWWHLEPDGYYFHFLPRAGKIQLRVMFAIGSTERTKKEVLSVSGTKEEILLPIWCALRGFESFNAQEPNWPPVDYRLLKNVGEALHGRPAV
ncbi:MAG: hypothetical protein ACU837_13420 [Gammaproteobacteria bacterium]